MTAQVASGFGPPVDDGQVAAKAQRLGLFTAPLSAYTLKVHLAPGLLLGYSGFDRPQLAEGVERLALAIDV